ncbi:MAG: FtsH protease activity modulator HflK [Gracilimonas sp.]|uniref:Protein HflK n=1 Tax=Gracilimonas sediminicola TaxID=2952158 RepID=A0A9X2L1Z9_9BACT|nr:MULTISPECIES: FtsH protease activity modulator HflK [Gracilimonas]MBO6587430.1 FtsH protease activity modulator HflK [Gracilimonas sp.]MBO6617057.1 FtsH protease activity modulator HflK [Gracilimonas sp.]MCP9290871.1 FtsH protease activity modulator HflK [Gracilimonas sediminicola]
MAQDQNFDFNVPPQFEKISKNIRLIIGGLIVALLGFSTFFTVDPEEVGVVVRLGKFVETVEPGLNYKLPLIDQVELVPVERQLKQEFGYRTVQAGVQTRYQKAGYEDESLMLTGDLNLADVEWVVQYRINDPYSYLFKVRNAESTLSDISEAAMRQIVGDRTVNEVLTVGRAEVSIQVQQLIQSLVTEYEMGITIEQVVLQDINPPNPVKPSFNAVNEAQQQRETLINQARADYNRVIPRARGEAQETIQRAEGYASERVNTAEGEVSRFNDLYSEYIKAPEVTKRRIFLETMEDIIPKMGKKIITDQNGNNVLPLLQLQLDGARSSTNQNDGGN